jgi:protein-tyrosine phosphatase
MDVSNLMQVLSMSRTDADRNKVSLILEEVAPNMNRSVPDPFYGNIEGFEEVYELLQEASEVIVKKLA